MRCCCRRRSGSSRQGRRKRKVAHLRARPSSAAAGCAPRCGGGGGGGGGGAYPASLRLTGCVRAHRARARSSVRLRQTPRPDRGETGGARGERGRRGGGAKQSMLQRGVRSDVGICFRPRSKKATCALSRSSPDARWSARPFPCPGGRPIPIERRMAIATPPNRLTTQRRLCARGWRRCAWVQ